MIYPSGTKIVVRPDEIDEVTEGGIFVPATARDQQQHAVTRGKLFAIGPEAELCYIDDNGVKQPMKVGDRVMFVKYAGAMLRKDRVEYRILQDEDVVCRLTDEEKEVPDTRKPMVK